MIARNKNRMLHSNILLNTSLSICVLIVAWYQYVSSV